MSVARVLAKADIPHDHQLRHRLLDGGHRTLHRAFHIPCAGADFIFILRQTEHLYCRYAQSMELFRDLYGMIHRQVKTARHTRDFLLHMLSRHYENRVDKILHRKRMLPHHIPHPRRNPHPARTKLLYIHVTHLLFV